MTAMPTLPDGVVPYRRTASWTADTLPAALRSQHTTKPGVWARVVVTEGALVLRLLDGSDRAWRLTPGVVGVVPPEVPHEVAPDGAVTVHVEFCRAG